MQTFNEIRNKPQTFSEVAKFNPYHGRDGRFTTADGAAMFTYKPGKGKMYDNAIAREKERTAAAAANMTPEEKRAKALNDVESKIRSQSYESAAVIDKDGNQLLFKDGEKDFVAFTSEESRMMIGATLTHNHPNSSAFSNEDVKMFVYNNLQEIRAVGANGNTYSLSREKDYSKNYIQENKFVDAYGKSYVRAAKKAQKDLDDRGFREKLRSGEITADEANTEFRKQISGSLTKYLSRYAKTYGFEFSMEGEL